MSEDEQNEQFGEIINNPEAEPPVNLTAEYEMLLQDLNVDPSLIPKEFEPSPDKPFASQQQQIIEGLCLAGAPWRTHEVKKLLSDVANHREKLSDILFTVKQLRHAFGKIENNEDKLKYREIARQWEERKQMKEERMENRDREHSWRAMLTKAGWSRFVALSLSSLGREKTGEDNRSVAAYMYTDTRIFEGGLPNDHELETAITLAANRGFLSRDNEGNLKTIKLPLYQYDNDYTNSSTVRIVDATKTDKVDIPDEPADLLVIRCKPDEVVDVPTDIYKHPLVVYIYEDKTPIEGTHASSEMRTVISVKAAHEAGDGIHIGILQGRIRDALKLHDVSVLTNSKIKEYADWNAKIAKPVADYAGDYMPENITIGNDKVNTYLSLINSKLKSSGVLDINGEPEKIKFKEILTLISEDLLAARTGSFEVMGHLLFSPNLEERLHHLRGEGILSMMQIIKLLDKESLSNEEKIKISKHLESLRSQRKLKEDQSNNNMRFLKAAARYPQFIQSKFNDVSKQYWQGGMEKIIGRHMESLVPNKLSKERISNLTQEDLDNYKRKDPDFDPEFSFGIGMANPALMPPVHTGAVTISPMNSKDILVVDDETGEESGGFTTFSLKYVARKN